MPYNDQLRAKLTAIYEDLMWLAARPHLTPARARAWYSAVMREMIKRQVCLFTGYVSRAALTAPNDELVLEHYNRLSHSLTALLSAHKGARMHNPSEFILLIESCEKVNITTKRENQIIQQSQGNYAGAGIELMEWNNIENDKRRLLYHTKLRGKVANYADYAPHI